MLQKLILGTTVGLVCILGLISHANCKAVKASQESIEEQEPSLLRRQKRSSSSEGGWGGFDGGFGGDGGWGDGFGDQLEPGETPYGDACRLHRECDIVDKERCRFYEGYRFCAVCTRHWHCPGTYNRCIEFECQFAGFGG